MFEERDVEWDPGEPPWDVEEEPPRTPLPEVPEWLLSSPWVPDEDDGWYFEEALAMMDPAERFEFEYGRPATPEQLVVFGNTSQEAALSAQGLAVQAARMRTIAEAHRVHALLTAHEASMTDLESRFGVAYTVQGGLGQQAFNRSFGLLTKTHPNHVAHEVATARTLRDRLPATWAAFQHGEASWNRARLVVSQADGLDDGNWAVYDEKAAGLAVTSNRLKDDLRKARERLQDDTAARQARTTYERRRTSLELGADSGVAFVAEGLATTWVPINDGLQSRHHRTRGHRGDPLHRRAPARHRRRHPHRRVTAVRRHQPRHPRPSPEAGRGVADHHRPRPRVVGEDERAGAAERVRAHRDGDRERPRRVREVVHPGPHRPVHRRPARDGPEGLHTPRRPRQMGPDPGRTVPVPRLHHPRTPRRLGPRSRFRRAAKRCGGRATGTTMHGSGRTAGRRTM